MFRDGNGCSYPWWVALKCTTALSNWLCRRGWNRPGLWLSRQAMWMLDKWDGGYPPFDPEDWDD